VRIYNSNNIQESSHNEEEKGRKSIISVICIIQLKMLVKVNRISDYCNLIFTTKFLNMPNYRNQNTCNQICLMISIRA